MTQKIPHQQLKNWFQKIKRDLPWRRNPSSYMVWISEVMLQQTQVAVVKPYFEKWLKRFPTVKHLAEASLEEVIKCWEGLGYYSRARNLHAGAKYVMENFKGELPQDFASLDEIKGLGPYTIGAIRSFAFHQKAAAVDGNVIRVLSRYYAIEDDISKPKTIKKLWQLAEENLPDDESWIFNEALIELGATVCARNPKCYECPLASTCQGYQQGIAHELPFKSKKTKIENLLRTVAIIHCDDYLLLQKGQEGKIMRDLYEFPYFNSLEKKHSEKNLIKELSKEWGLDLKLLNKLPTVSHSFTRYRVQLSPIVFEASRRLEVKNFHWIPFKEIKNLAFSSGHRRILETFKNEG